MACGAWDKAMTTTRYADIRAMVSFLPLFESKGFHFGRWESAKGQFPYFVHSESAEAFIEAVYDRGWCVSFDWPKWQRRAELYVRDPSKVAAARIGTIRKLLTTHVRKERCCEGHLNEMFENGHLTAILHRLRKIGDSMTDR